MAIDIQDTLERIVAKTRVLVEKYNVLLQSKQELEQQTDELKRRLVEREKQLQKLSQEVEYLRTASVLAPNRDQVEATRAAIANIVREIDRCITDLSD